MQRPHVTTSTDRTESVRKPESPARKPSAGATARMAPGLGATAGQLLDTQIGGVYY